MDILYAQITTCFFLGLTVVGVVFIVDSLGFAFTGRSILGIYERWLS